MELEDEAVYRYVAFGELDGLEQTHWKGIRRLPPAHWLRLRWTGDRFELRMGRYWDIDLDREEPIDPEMAAQRFRELFSDSIRLRLRSDVPVGTSLSGGLDSSSIVCQIHAQGSAIGQKAFSARMEIPALDEGRHIEAVLAKTGVEGHGVWPMASEFRELFEPVCWTLEEPFLQTSQYCQYLVMRLASEHGVTVLLDGQGADELLAGYRPYFRVRYADLARRWRWIELERERRAFVRRHGTPFPLSLKSAIAIASRRVDADANPRRALIQWFSSDWAREFESVRPLPSRASGRDALTQRLYSDTFGGPLQQLLRYGDRNSMAWSREVRLPFLDHRLAEFLFSLPVRHKLASGETKVVLRRAVRGLIPDSIADRQDKLGYQAPLPTWMAGELATWVEERLEQARDEFPTLQPDIVDRFRVERTRLSEPTAREVFSVLSFSGTSRAIRQAPVAVAVRT
jgi:asparagine synthase (glutamine-hydrolysing)